jgi:Tol biopolymer transport system component
VVWVDRQGTVQPLQAPPRPYQNPRLSPDGRQIVFSINEVGKSDLWVYDIPRNTLTRLTFEGNNTYPIWTPDGKRVVYRSLKKGMPDGNLFWRPADGSGSEERLTTSDNQHTALSFTPDGKILVYAEYNPITKWDLWTLPLEGERKRQLILQTPFNERTACLSPDGRWLAYVSDESERYEVYVRPFPGPGGKFQVSLEGASEIIWLPNGDLTYRAGANREKMMAVNIQTQPVFKAGTPRLIFEAPYASNATIGAWSPGYSASADGQRFLMLKAKEDPQREIMTQISIIQNWFEELKQRVPVK